MNVANVPKLLPSIASPDFVRLARDVRLSDFIAAHEAETAALARSLGRPFVFMLNPPQWQWYDIPPEVLAETPSVRFFEVCNNGTEIAACPDLPQDGFDTDRFWDVVNAFRARRGLPLLAVPTLKLLCVPVLLGKEDLPEDALLIPMIDARRMEVYSAVYDRALKEVRPVGADIVEADTYLPYLAEHPTWFFGNGAKKCQDVIQHENAHFIEGIMPLAKWMSPLAERALLLGEKQDTAYFEPFYLKEFAAIKPKNILYEL